MNKVKLVMIPLLLLSGCGYAPSSEDVVEKHREISNQERFLEFVNHVNQGEEDKVRVVRYTTEGDPILHDLAFNGKTIKLTVDNSRDKFGSETVQKSTCESLEVKEAENRTDYTLIGCGKEKTDERILTIWK